MRADAAPAARDTIAGFSSEALMKRSLIAPIVLLAVGACVAFYVLSRRSAIKRAYEAIGRAEEYWDSGALLFEPRYLEAEKAVSEIGDGFLDPLPAAKLRACLANIPLARESLKIGADLADDLDHAMSDHVSPKRIAELKGLTKDAQDSASKFEAQARKCVSDEGD